VIGWAEGRRTFSGHELVVVVVVGLGLSRVRRSGGSLGGLEAPATIWGADVWMLN
jgi:hypothetical protein